MRPPLLEGVQEVGERTVGRYDDGAAEAQGAHLCVCVCVCVCFVSEWKERGRREGEEDMTG